MASNHSNPLSPSTSSGNSPDQIHSEVATASTLLHNPSTSSTTLLGSRSTPEDSSKSSPEELCRSLNLDPELLNSKGDTAGPLGPIAPMSKVPESWASASTLNTSSDICERLDRLELERDERRRAAEEKHAIAERLKRESGAAGLSATEAKLRVMQLRRDIRAAGAMTPRRSTVGLFKAVCSTDLLFLIDTTGSMAASIHAAKEQVKSIVNDIQIGFFNETEVRIAVVAYKDHSDKPNIQFLDFTNSVDRVKSFISGLAASGGLDAPEDVLGGIRQALNASWQQQTKCIIHIADAPPHGNTLHNLGATADDYSTPGSEPHKLTHGPLLKQMIDLKINYALLRINQTTDRMAFTFFQEYVQGSSDCKLLKSNIYYSQACDIAASSRSSYRNSKHKAGPLFQEFELGTSFSALRHLVVKVVTTSASRTAVRLSASGSRTGKTSKMGVTKNLKAIEEDEDDAEDTQMETIAPVWETRSWFNETLEVEGFSPDIEVHGASTLEDMMAHDDNIMMGITELTLYKRSRPFAQGAMRIAAYARTAASANRFVVKSFKRGGKRLPHLAEDMRGQALCKAFALEFSALSGEEHSLDFIVTTCLKRKSGKASSDECLSLEPFIEGTYVKYNNNCGYVNEDDPEDMFNRAAQAFSHFTFERSKGHFLVSDLQGVGKLLTDPAIHTLDPERFKLSDTNLGKEGFKFFFSTHVCNALCNKLGLKSNASMIMSNKYEFRDNWPIMDETVCCTNKLCGKIVHLASAKQTDQFPGYWCDTCFPQLSSSIQKWICVAPGPHHEFDMSEFFLESQGGSTQRRCPEHREKEVSIIRTARVSEFFADLQTRSASDESPASSKKKGDLVVSKTPIGSETYRKDGSETVVSAGCASNIWARLKSLGKKKSTVFK